MTVQVSVIIPTFNATKSIERTLDSILCQTYQNFEIIIVDDKSTDGTFELLKKLKKKDKRINIYQNHQNCKSAYTRNKAIALSLGKYIMQMDDDDYCSKDRMEKQVEFLDNHKSYDFVGSNSFLFDDEGIYGAMKMIEFPSKRDLIKTSPFINPSVMFRKHSLNKVNGYRVSNETTRAQDYDLYLRMYVLGMKGYNIQENLIYYYKDTKTFNKSSFHYRFGEAKFRYRNFKKMGLFPRAIPYVIKPMILAVIPNKILSWNHKKRGINRTSK